MTPKHFIREKHLDKRKVFELNFRYLTPLRDKHTKQIRAVALSNRCREYEIGVV